MEKDTGAHLDGLKEAWKRIEAAERGSKEYRAACRQYNRRWRAYLKHKWKHKIDWFEDYGDENENKIFDFPSDNVPPRS